MHAVLLAAGRSQRLGDLTSDLPKCLLEVGGRPFIMYSLENLVRGGVREITIVTGHCDGAIQNMATISLGHRSVTGSTRIMRTPEASYPC